MSKASIWIRKAARAAFGVVFLCAGLSLFGCAVTTTSKGIHVMAPAAYAWQNSGTQNIFTELAEFESETEAAAEAFYAEATERYEACVPTLEEALSAYREDKDFTVDYAAYDRYFYFDSFSLPEGTIAILSRDNTCMGYRMNLRCREAFDYDSIYGSTSSDREILCEYYEIGDIRYFSYVDSNLTDTPFSIPNFMCMTDMEQIYAIDRERESWTVYRNEFNPFGEQGFFWEAEATGLIREYIEMSGSLYRIDREQKALFPVRAPERTLPSGTPALADYVYRNWLYKQKELCQNLLYKIAVSVEDVEAVLPDGYMLRWSNDYTVSDLNGDGILDILALICPVLEQYDTKNSYYAEDSPYRKVPEYYYLELWWFAGQPDGSFLGECLMDSDSLVWDDTFTLTSITGFPGGCFMEYFVGRAPFETVLFKFAYDSGEWKLVGQYGNDGYSTPAGFYAYTEDILAAEELYKVSVKDYVNEQYAALLSGSGYTDYGSLFQLPDEALVQRINEALRGEMDKLFGAMEALDECHDVLLQNDFIFLNGRVAVLEFKFMDSTTDGVSVDRYLPVSIDLATGEIIDFRDYITAEELGRLLACTNPDCKTEENLALFDLYDDYETLLKAGGDSMTLLLVHEGLIILNTDKYWPDCCLIPRCRLLDSPLAVFWDDWN